MSYLAQRFVPLVDCHQAVTTTGGGGGALSVQHLTAQRHGLVKFSQEGVDGIFPGVDRTHDAAADRRKPTPIVIHRRTVQWRVHLVA
ncbi:unnamed protein product [Aphanomyces euteiches]